MSHVTDHLEYLPAATLGSALAGMRERLGIGQAVRVTVPNLEAAARARDRGDRGFFSFFDSPDHPSMDVLFSRWAYRNSETGPQTNAFDADSLSWWLRGHGFDVETIETDTERDPRLTVVAVATAA